MLGTSTAARCISSASGNSTARSSRPTDAAALGHRARAPTTRRRALEPRTSRRSPPLRCRRARRVLPRHAVRRARGRPARRLPKFCWPPPTVSGGAGRGGASAAVPGGAEAHRNCRALRRDGRRRARKFAARLVPKSAEGASSVEQRCSPTPRRRRPAVGGRTASSEMTTTLVVAGPVILNRRDYRPYASKLRRGPALQKKAAGRLNTQLRPSPPSTPSCSEEFDEEEVGHAGPPPLLRRHGRLVRHGCAEEEARGGGAADSRRGRCGRKRSSYHPSSRVYPTRITGGSFEQSDSLLERMGLDSAITLVQAHRSAQRFRRHALWDGLAELRGGPGRVGRHVEFRPEPAAKGERVLAQAPRAAHGEPFQELPAIGKSPSRAGCGARAPLRRHRSARSPLGLGVLSGKYDERNLPDGPRGLIFRALLPSCRGLLATLREVAAARASVWSARRRDVLGDRQRRARHRRHEGPAATRRRRSPRTSRPRSAGRERRGECAPSPRPRPRVRALRRSEVVDRRARLVA